MTDTEIIAYHGWGFDATCWRPWVNLCPDTICWLNADRGYFNNPQCPHFSNGNKKKVLVTHSFGLHHCTDEKIIKADLLVIFSGFLRFHPKAVSFRRRSKQVVNEMIKQFGEQPQNVLNAFYRNVFHPEKSYELPPQEMDCALLLDDLKWLNRADRLLPPLKDSAKVCIFHGTEDAIVPRRKGRALYEQFAEQAQYFEIKGAGHALPMTHAEKCWNIITNKIFCLTN